MKSSDFWYEYIPAARKLYVLARPVDANADLMLAAMHEWLKKIEMAIEKAVQNECQLFFVSPNRRGSGTALRIFTPAVIEKEYSFVERRRQGGRFVAIARKALGAPLHRRRRRAEQRNFPLESSVLSRRPSGKIFTPQR